MKRVLLVEDDAGLADVVKLSLARESFDVEVSPSFNDARTRIKADDYDLIILDWNLPDGSGVDICRILRSRERHTPIIMLTAMDDIRDKELGFSAGADDYLTKPFATRELIARVKALLRRPAQFVNKTVVFGPISVDLTSRRVFKHEEEVHLKPLEFDLLEFFIRHSGQLVSTDLLIRRVWPGDGGSIDSLYSSVNSLRKKLGTKEHEFPLRTVHKTGYVFSLPSVVLGDDDVV
jgi:DNA-binding response OmpR family regulator